MDVRMVDDWTCTRIVRGRFTVEGEKGMTFSVLPFMGEGEYTLLEGRIKYPVDHLALTASHPIGISTVSYTHLRRHIEVKYVKKIRM